MKFLIAGTTAALFLAGTAYGESLEINPGEWTYTTSGTMEMMGMNMPVPEESETECVTEEDAVFDSDDIADENCELSLTDSTSTSQTYSMMCDAEGTTMTGEVFISVEDGGNSVALTTSMQGETEMGAMQINVNVAGERVGQCQ